jgi:hypothetical protein
MIVAKFTMLKYLCNIDFDDGDEGVVIGVVLDIGSI